MAITPATYRAGLRTRAPAATAPDSAGMRSSSCWAKQRRYRLLWQQQQQMVTPIWLTLLLLVHALVPCIHAVPAYNMQQQFVQQQQHDSAGHTAADADHSSTSAASPAAATASWESLRGQARQRRQQFKQHIYQQQQLLPPRAGQQQPQEEEHPLQVPLTLQDGSLSITDSDHNLKPTDGARMTSTRWNTHIDRTAATHIVRGTVPPGTGQNDNTVLSNNAAVDGTVLRDSAAVADAVPGAILPSTGTDSGTGLSVDVTNGLTLDMTNRLTVDANGLSVDILGDSAATADSAGTILPSTSTYTVDRLPVDAIVLKHLSDSAAVAVAATTGPYQAATAAGDPLDYDIAAAAAVDNATFHQVDMTQTAAAQGTSIQHPAAGMPHHHHQQQQQQQDQQRSFSAVAVQRSDTGTWSTMTAAAAATAGAVAAAAAAAGLPVFDLYKSDSSVDKDRELELSDSSIKNMGLSRSSFALAPPMSQVPAATTAAAAAAAADAMGRSLTEAAAAATPPEQQQQQQRPSAVGAGDTRPAAAAAAGQMQGPAPPPALIADPNVPTENVAAPAPPAAPATPPADLPLDSLAQSHADTAGVADSTALTASDASTATEGGTTAAAAAAVAANPATGPVSSSDNAAAGVPSAAAAGAVEVGASSGSSSSSVAASLWKPRVLDTPVPKWPRLYSTVAPPAPTLAAAARPAAVQALLSAAAAARTPQGISISGIPGLSLEDKILLARLLGHVINGTFDDLGQMDPANTAYWEQLDAQLEKHTQVKHMFESIWYKCSKLNTDLLMRASTAYDMEIEALQHILAWLGFPETHLPRPGEFANFDDLVALLNGIGAKARLVTDPVPFLATTRPPLDRNGMPMLIHMTFKDKGQFARHHLLSLASWSKENPDHAILMYDDADLEAYLSTYDPSVLEVYSSLKTAVERSDLWRYVVMCKHGGVYTDADTLCVRPIQEWNSENHNDAEAMFGVEDVFKRDPHRGNSGWGVSMGRFGIQFEQWTLAGAAKHPVYCNMHSFISQRMKEEASKLSPVASTESENWSILHRTGPHVWTDSVLEWMHDQGIGFHEALVPGGRLVSNNTRILPGETFGCAAHFFSPAARLEEVYAMHMFRGVWRKRLDSGEPKLPDAT